MFFTGYTDASVADREMQRNILAGDRLHASSYHNFATLGKFESIAHHVQDNLAKTHWVADQVVRHVIFNAAGKLEPLLRGTDTEGFDGILENVANVERDGVEIQLARLDLGKVQYIVDDLQ